MNSDSFYLFLNEKLPRKRFLLVCGKYREFEDFCKFRLQDYLEKDITEFEGCEFVYYSHEDAIRGLRFDDIIHYGTYYMRRDINVPRILSYIKKRYSSWEEVLRSEYYEKYG